MKERHALAIKLVVEGNKTDKTFSLMANDDIIIEILRDMDLLIWPTVTSYLFLPLFIGLDQLVNTVVTVCSGFNSC